MCNTTSDKTDETEEVSLPVLIYQIAAGCAIIALLLWGYFGSTKINAGQFL